MKELVKNIEQIKKQVVGDKIKLLHLNCLELIGYKTVEYSVPTHFCLSNSKKDIAVFNSSKNRNVCAVIDSIINRAGSSALFSSLNEFYTKKLEEKKYEFAEFGEKDLEEFYREVKRLSEDNLMNK